MALQLDTTMRNNMLDEITARVGTSAQIRVYSGSKPANCGASLSGNTLLAQLTGNASAFAPAATGGVLTPNAVSDDTAADNTGTASFFRVYDSGGATCMVQGDVGTSGSDMNFNTVSFVQNAVVKITSWTITAPGA